MLVVETGTASIPLAVRVSSDGGFLFALANAPTEEIVIDNGKVATSNLGGCKLPTMVDMPPLRTVLGSDGGLGPFGAKAVGELANNPVAPAVANAIADAVGARVRSTPFTAERVLDALQGPIAR